MILRINPADKVIPASYKFRQTRTMKNNAAPLNEPLTGVPKSYIAFRGNEVSLNYTDDAKFLLEKAEEIAKSYNHNEILPQHILQAVIEMTEQNLQELDEELLNAGAVESVSPLSKLANEYADMNFLVQKSSRRYFETILNNLKEDNMTFLEILPAQETQADNIEISPNLLEVLKQTGEKTHNIIDSIILTGVSMNSITNNGNLYTSDFLTNAKSYAAYCSKEDIQKNYMKVYDNRAVDVWNKLALGSNLIVAYKNAKEADRITASIIKTINQPKYGCFNSKNTSIYVMKDNVNANTVLGELNRLKEANPDGQKIVLLKMDNLLVNTLQENNDELNFYNLLNQIVGVTNEKLKLIIFQSDDVFYNIKSEPMLEALFSNMVSYAIPPVQTYEARGMLTKKMLQDVKHPFTKEAKDRAVYHAANLNGIFPDKAVDLMKRISSYYGDSKSKITSVNVDEFAQIGYELFRKKSGKSNIIYDTGKNLNTLYGKETTKKDVEAIIKQIKTGKIGTRGIIISSKDNEAGSGRKYTAETIAGETKIPFLSIDTADFAATERDLEGIAIESPRNKMKRFFAEIKNAARQNQYKTALIYINDFEEFVLSGPYIPGYKQAVAQLSYEMKNAKDEDISIIVMGSTDAYYANIIPMVIRGFNQALVVDTPAFNKKSRKETVINGLNEINLPLAYKKAEERENMLNRIVKLTEYMSFVEIKSLLEKTKQIMFEREKTKATIGDFIEAYLQLDSGRTSRPEMPEYNKQITTSHECGHATNLEVMKDILERKGKPWHKSRNVNFITLDPRGNFLGAVFEDRDDNNDYPFEAMFTGLVCSYGGYSCEKAFFGMDGSIGISSDLAQATHAAKQGIEKCGFGFYTGKISNAVSIQSPAFYEKIYKDIDVILTNAKIASDLITETYRQFNEWFTQKYYKLIGTDDCMVDGNEFRQSLKNWETSLSADKKQEIDIMEDIIMDIIKKSKNGQKYYQLKRIL